MIRARGSKAAIQTAIHYNDSKFTEQKAHHL